MKRKNMDPYRYSLQHCQVRAYERYGYNLVQSAYDELNELVRADMVRRCFPKEIPNFVLVDQDGTQSTLVVPFRGRTLIAVFDADRSLVTTLLPPEDFARYLHF